jgi:hypothetical protein
MNALKKLAATTALFLGLMVSGVSFGQEAAPPAAPAAPAAPEGLGLSSGNSHLQLTGATFNDLYWVWLPSISNLSAYGTSSPFQYLSINVPAATFDTVTLTGPSGLIGTLLPGSSSFELSGSSFASGYYVLNVIGHATGGQAAYAVQMDVTPVPEPETYALMLAGLGLLGLVARRRKNG